MRIVINMCAVCVLVAGCAADGVGGADDLHPRLHADDAAELAIDLWNQEMPGFLYGGRQMSELSEQCEDVARGAEFTVVSRDEIYDGAYCAQPGVYGCFRGWWRANAEHEAGADIVLLNSTGGLSLQTKTHELVHALLACESNRPDGDHTLPIWLRAREVWPY